MVNVTVQVTARANGGFFKFKLCKSDASTAASQACFDQNPLKLANTADQTIIQIPDIDGDVVVPLQLPAGLTCDQCVMQWTWVTGGFLFEKIEIQQISLKKLLMIIIKYYT